MDSGTCTDQSSCSKDPSRKSLEILDAVSGPEADKELVQPPTIADGTVSLGPITPDVNRENGDFPCNSPSPLTAIQKSPVVPCFVSKSNLIDDPLACVDDDGGDNDDDSSPQTPKNGVFDPFAPGPDDMVLAPLSKKSSDQMRSSVTRSLRFHFSVKAMEHEISGYDVESISDEEMFESVYENLLEAIVSKQAEGVFGEIPNVDWDSDDCKTPPLAPHANGVAETCPGAPMKPAGKSRNIDLGLCRKLEF